MLLLLIDKNKDKMKQILTLSENHNPNYVCYVTKIKELIPIEGAQTLVKTVVEGFDTVVSKDMKVGDIVLYFPVECQINKDFLAANNLFEFSLHSWNANAMVVDKWLSRADEKENDEGNKEGADELRAQAKRMCGFFNKHGRVRCINLMKNPSQGFVIPVDSLAKWKPDLASIDWNEYIEKTFDTIDGELFVKKYIKFAPVSKPNDGTRNERKRNKKLKKFDRLVEEQFEFHYDTQQLPPNIWKISPKSIIHISKKVHGSSFIVARILCNRKLTLFEKVKKFFGCNIKAKEYGNIYSSRSVIKNRYLNPNANDFYGVDIWKVASDLFYPYLDDGMTVYGEIAGYIPNNQKMIQKDYDYGCKPGETKFMPYRITMVQENGETHEWNASEVLAWTLKFIEEHPEHASKILPMTEFYHGEAKDLYPDIDTENHWHENVLARMKLDERFNMEKNEPACWHKVPAEGIVVKIDDDPKAEAWKLKCQNFYRKETSELDKGEVDIETQESEGGQVDEN